MFVGDDEVLGSEKKNLKKNRERSEKIGSEKQARRKIIWCLTSPWCGGGGGGGGGGADSSSSSTQKKKKL